MAERWRGVPAKKGGIETVGKTPVKRFGDLGKSKKKLNGLPDSLLDRYGDLFHTCSDLFFGCSQFSKRDISEPFKDLETEAFSLVKRKNVVSDSIDALFQVYIKQEYPRQDSRAIALKRESRLIIERVQRSIENCRPLMDEVRQKRKPAGPEAPVDLDEVGFGDDLENPFDEAD